MPKFQTKAKITRFEQLSNENVRLTLHCPEIAAATRPGQFVMIQTGYGKDPLLRRPFSVHQTSSSGNIQILFKIVGRGTKILAHCKEGEELSVLGPLGHGYTIKKNKDAILVGGGLGIAPMLFLAKRIARLKKDSTSGTIILGGRSSGEVEPLIEDFSQFSMAVKAATDDGSFGQQGFVTDILKECCFKNDPVVYTCGPEPMMKAVRDICKEHGIQCQVSIESVMACGMGACLGCTTHGSDGEYKHVCIDGPVFQAEDLKWTS